MKEQMKDLYGQYYDDLIIVDGRLSVKDNAIGVNGMQDYYVIPGYSRYYIRKDGTVYDRIGMREIRPKESGSNYPYYSLQADGSDKQRTVDQQLIMALSFLPIPDIGKRMEVNHIDHNRRNCSIENLEWVTRSQNIIHGKNYRLVDGSYIEKRRNYVIKFGRRVIMSESDINIVTDWLGINKTKLLTLMHKNKNAGEFVYNDYTVIFRDIDEPQENKRVVFIHDMVQNELKEVPTITSASLITGIIRSSVTDMLNESSDEFGKIIKGYRFYRDNENEFTKRILTDVETVYHKYCRLNDVPHNSVGYIVYSILDNKAYPYHSLRDMPKKFRSSKMTYPRLGEMARCGMGDGKFEIVPIYVGNNTSYLTEHIRDFMSKYKPEYILDVQEYFD